ncbi:HAD family hydrolase [Ktedonospora formicarum]|uniref:Haloacid dehalogenase n=1 Tax=Ktedonospora formicarum TaxID=2778364 RepID=A0A8J3MRR4_9CHLR|nr:HAD family hydrolase [Ktedonospora formicarum]GHO42545.1 haloacid dehalogenase [Ktedonospora formicarum]
MPDNSENTQTGLQVATANEADSQAMPERAGAIRAIIFDLGGTLIDWPDWDEDIERRWGLSYDHLIAYMNGRVWPEREAYIQAMRAAEKAHWQRVTEQHMSETADMVLLDGFHRLTCTVNERELLTALDGYANAVIGWAIIFPEIVGTLIELRKRGYRLGLLSNTWWAASWHNADLAAHGLTSLLDVVMYTSELPYSKPHPYVFKEAARRLHMEPSACVMVGDRMADDVGGALSVGMRGVWRYNEYPWPKPKEITPSAVITTLTELLTHLELWEEADSPATR